MCEPPPVKRTEKKYKVFSQPGRYARLWQPEIRVICYADNPNFRFLSGGKIKLMFFHRGQNAQIALYPAIIVVTDVAVDHLDQFLFAGKASAIVTFPFQDAPEAFHWAVVDTMRHTGHALRHACLLQLVVKGSTGVLEPSVAMEQGMCIKIGFHSLVKGFIDKRIIVMFTQYIRHNTPVIQIQDGAEIKLVNRDALIPFELGNIRQPLLVRPVCVELAV